PEIGWINAPLKGAFGFSLSAYTIPGMVWIEGLHSAPLAFVLMSAAFRTMDPSLEEAAAASRADPWKTLRRVTLPLLLPTAASVVLILFVRTLESFEVPAIIGLPGRVFVYTSRIYLALQHSSFILADDLTRAAIVNSLKLALVSATVVVAITSVVAWITIRTRTPGRGLLDFLAFVPIAIPGIVLGVSLVWLYSTIQIGIYGTIWILIIAYVTRYLPYGIRSMSGG